MTPVSPAKDELLPCPFCGTVLSPYTTHRSQEQMWKHPLSGCVLSRFTVALEETTAWNTRAAMSPVDRLREALERTESRCDDCGGINPVWFAPNTLWNLVIGGPDAKGDPGGFVCPVCFISRAEAVGVRPTAWELRPEHIAALASPEPVGEGE